MLIRCNGSNAWELLEDREPCHLTTRFKRDDGVVRALSFLQPPRRVQETVCFVASFNQLDLSYESEKGTIGFCQGDKDAKLTPESMKCEELMPPSISSCKERIWSEQIVCVSFQKHVCSCNFLKDSAMTDYSNKLLNHLVEPLKE